MPYGLHSPLQILRELDELQLAAQSEPLVRAVDSTPTIQALSALGVSPEKPRNSPTNAALHANMGTPGSELRQPLLAHFSDALGVNEAKS
jgi:hypothetical protein